ncbi:hypothetical protein LMORI2_23170 [Limnohabitans sp. MORI2]|uniref:hypothetical protein n=1 Tax=Limnohabitans sp. MORI2 TaxID=1751150 RepID=UPI002377357E|nr:hypothetical protein [Limnohabitans sp. MORI2]BDU59335.1 hypothetical protein LMORI2_23170 [Limnohabitans sp. MORI2]
MNSTVVLALSIGFAVLCFLLLCLCMHGNLTNRNKMLMVLVVTASYFIGYQALNDSQGWASSRELPPRFVLLAAVIEEPLKDKTKGEIFVWLQPLTDNRPSGEPRAFRFPYEKGLHSLFEEGMKKNRNGNSQMGVVESAQRGSRGVSWLKPAGADVQRIKLRDMPAAQLPEK